MTYTQERDALVEPIVEFVFRYDFRKHRGMLTASERAMLRLATVYEAEHGFSFGKEVKPIAPAF